MIDFSPNQNLLGSTAGDKATRGVGKGRAKSTVDRVLYETRQKMHSVREVLVGHGPGGFPEPGELVRLTTFADINALTILLRAVEVFGTLEELYLSAYSINQRAIFALRQMLDDGGIKYAVVLGSDTITWRDPQRIREMWETAETRPNIRFGMASNHAKTYAWKARHKGHEHHIVCATSANLASNSRIEDYVLTNSEEGLDHLKSWMEEVMQPIPDPATLKDARI